MIAWKGFKNFLRVFVIALIFIFCIFSLMPLPCACAEESCKDFEAFSASLMNILAEFDVDESSENESSNEEILALEASDSVPQNARQKSGQAVAEKEINRLIVNSHASVSDFGAVAKAEFESVHIFQYDNSNQAEKAFEFFSNSGYDVSYDAITTLEDVSVESVYTSNPWKDKTFKSWGAEYVGFKKYVENLNKTSPTLNNVVVAVLDSGINTSHELLRDKILFNYARDFTGEKSSTPYTFEDLNNHGSHVSGIIADATLDNVKILPLKVLKGDGKGTVSMIVSALEYVKALKISGVDIQVLNMSIGIESRNGEAVRNIALENAVVAAYECGVVPVVSAGNDSMDTSYACPANVKEAITVSALYQSRGNLYFDSFYSNYGSYVDFSAPGTSIISAGKLSATSYVSMSGTSMAAPHISACVALIYSNMQFKNYSVDNIYKLLQENVIDLGSEGWDQYYGHGCVNIESIGITYAGYVSFSVEKEFLDPEKQQCFSDAFMLSLSYTEIEGDVSIYYTMETADSATVTEEQRYTSPIRISKTTKITAVAYVNAQGSSFTQSYVSSQMYYFDDKDLLSNFEFDSYSYYGYKITKYNGKLTTLDVPTLYNGKYIVSIGSNAFNASRVAVLRLPNSILRIEQSAFESNSSLREIYCASPSLQVDMYAFFKCSGLAKFEVPGVSKVGNYAFSYCSNLKMIELFAVESVGKHAFSGSGVEEVFFGKEIEIIVEPHTSLKLAAVYGYKNTVAEEFASNYNIKFVDLTLRFTKNLANSMIVKEDDVLLMQVCFSGLLSQDKNQSPKVVSNKSLLGTECDLQVSGDKTNKTVDVSISGLGKGAYDFWIELKDFYGQTVKSNVVKVDVVDELDHVFEISCNSTEHFNVYVDENLIENSALLYKDASYRLKVVPQEGYVLKSVTVGGVPQTDNMTPVGCEIIIPKNSNDLELVVITQPKELLLVTFNVVEGQVYVDGMLVNAYVQVERGASLDVEIVANSGYVVKSVMIGSSYLEANKVTGKFSIDCITTDLAVDVTFVEQYNNVQVSCGKGGSVSTTGSVGNGNLAYGTTRLYKISPNEGYEIDFVSVNGQRVAVTDNVFEVRNEGLKSEDVISVVISFKKTSGSIFSNASLLVYFIIFAGLFVVFVVAKLVLYFVRKKNKNKNRIHKYFY